MRHIPLTLSAAALLAALVGCGTTQALPLAAPPAPVVQTSTAPAIELAYYVHGGYRYNRRGHGYYHGRYYGGRYWRPGIGAVAGAPYYRYGSNAQWCLNRYGRRYVCGYY